MCVVPSPGLSPMENMFELGIMAMNNEGTDKYILTFPGTLPFSEHNNAVTYCWPHPLEYESYSRQNGSVLP